MERGFSIRARPLNPKSRSSRLSKSKWSDALMTDRTTKSVRASAAAAATMMTTPIRRSEGSAFSLKLNSANNFRRWKRAERDGISFPSRSFCLSKRMSPFSSTLSPPTSGQNNLSIHRLDASLRSSPRDGYHLNHLSFWALPTMNKHHSFRVYPRAGRVCHCLLFIPPLEWRVEDAEGANPRRRRTVVVSLQVGGT